MADKKIAIPDPGLRKGGVGKNPRPSQQLPAKPPKSTNENK
jgi:hypothetical protein